VGFTAPGLEFRWIQGVLAESAENAKEKLVKRYCLRFVKHAFGEIQSVNKVEKRRLIAAAEKLEYEQPNPFLSVLRALCENIPCIYQESDSDVAYL
jgi:hypothetical protein